MNIIVRELYAGKKTLLIWGGTMAAFIAMQFMEFAAYYKNPEMLAVLDAIPREMLEAFGLINANLTTVSGFLSVGMVFINVTLAVFAVMLGHNLLAKEERDRTAGFLLTLPVSRARVFVSKLAAGLLIALLLLGLTGASLFVATIPYEVEPKFPQFFALLLLTSYLTMVIFLCLGFLLAAVTRKHKLAAGVGLGTVFALYVTSVVSGLTEQTEFLRYVSPFEYFEASALLQDLRVEPLFAALALTVVVVSLTCAYAAYSRRDMYV
jgi:ABC-2 type transport system permease protein